MAIESVLTIDVQKTVHCVLMCEIKILHFTYGMAHGNSEAAILNKCLNRSKFLIRYALDFRNQAVSKWGPVTVYTVVNEEAVSNRNKAERANQSRKIAKIYSLKFIFLSDNSSLVHLVRIYCIKLIIIISSLWMISSYPRK